jgi:phosphate transport system substrate-binding protein
MRRRPTLRLAGAVALVATLVPVHGTPRAAAAGPGLNGGGSSFAKLEIDQWRAEVARKPYELDVNYVAQGSSFGRNQYIIGALDFAASDIPFQPAELSELNKTGRKDFAYVPVSAGGLGFMYNLIDSGGQQITNLNLDPNSACRMFTDDTMMWNDPALQALNPNLGLPDHRVGAIVRADGSGTSFVLSEFCIATAPDVWAAFQAAEQNNPSAVPELAAGDPISNWPTNRFGSAVAADGVAAAVADSSGLYGVTYNEAGFAKVRGFPNANMRNASGNFTQPTEQAVSIALGYATGRANGTFQLDFQGGDPAAYFPSTYSYVIAQTTGFDPAKGEVLARFLCYSITKGQRVELTEALGYARLSAPLVELGRVAIAKIPGAPPWDQCKVESAAPPPPPPSGGGSTGGGSTGGGSTGGGSTGGGAAPAGGGSAGDGSASAGGGSTGGGTAAGGGSTGGGTAAGGGSTGAGTVGAGALPASGANNSGAVTPLGAAGASGVVVCTDPDTGLAAACDSVASMLPVPGAGAAGGTALPASAKPLAPKNPVVEPDSGGPTATQILWWLLQGASICAVGFALAGAKTRLLS